MISWLILIQIKDRDRLINEIKKEREDMRLQTRKDYERFDSTHIQVCLTFFI